VVRDHDELRLSDGETIRADRHVFACGPWLAELFPELGADWICPTRQEIFYFGTPKGDSRFNAGECPLWIDNVADVYYGIPGTEWRGFKVASDSRGERVDPTTMDRAPTLAGMRQARDYLEFRFPGMKGAPLVESRVCQYENSADENFIIDRHPDAENVWLVGGGSGHGFKHGPALGEHVAAAVLGAADADPLFNLSRLSRFA
jgi:sarcosine oxidase